MRLAPRKLPVLSLRFDLLGLLAAAIASFLSSPAFGLPQGESQSDEHLFDTKIAPLLAARCLECHNETIHEGELDLTSLQSAIAGGDSGAALKANDLPNSLLWERIESGEMPPEHPLSVSEKELLSRWLKNGATWPAAIDRFQYTTESRAGYDWWSIQPWQATNPPERETEWGNNPIDAFVLQKLLAEGLKPSRPAAPRQQIRRLYFDLIGLPPPPEVVAGFEAEPTPEHYLTIVDDLLDSPEYGERWARHWLDVARFGESDGFERNNPRRTLWHYRDWVIQSLAADMPYDEFVRRQIAGDLETGDVAGASAVGFLVSGVHNTVVGGSERMKLLARQDELEELVGTVGQTFLGLTVNCARCHDHKFDPISSVDYYRLIATLDGVNHGEVEVPNADTAKPLAEARERLKGLRTEISKLESDARNRVLAQREQQPEKQKVETPEPVARWTFEGQAKDQIGDLDVELMGSATIETGGLLLDGDQGWARTKSLPTELREKTLEAWVLLDDLSQRGGAPISVQTTDGVLFDAIVFGEREPGQWMSGSNNFARTKSFNAPAETEANQQPVHIAVTYADDGTITAYRNGKPYGSAYQTTMQSFAQDNAQVIFGLRHGTGAGPGRMFKGKVLQAALYDFALEPSAIAASAGVGNAYVSPKAMLAAMTAAEQQAYAEKLELRRETESVVKELESAAKTKIYTVRPSRPGVMKVHVRGDVTNYGDEVSPGGIAVLGSASAEFGLPMNAGDADRREALANWITRDNQPLLARVMVNRVWQYHFGTGIADTPNDLGFNGGRPTHPELIEWMAGWFRDHEFRLKPLHRLMVTSATYQQDSRVRRAALEKDAQNRLLWRYPKRRVDAEYLRDAMLSSAGVLNSKRFGPGFEDVTVTQNSGTMYYEPFDREDPELNRRTIYRFSPRGGRSAVLDTFDCPDPSTAAPTRTTTTTPLQALTMLNNEFVLRMSKHFASRVRKAAPDDEAAQVEQVWKLAYGRSPTVAEVEFASPMIREHGLESLCRAVFNSNEFVVIE